MSGGVSLPEWPRVSGCQPGQGSLPEWPLMWEAWARGCGVRPPCLVPSLVSLTYHFHRKRAGARRVRRLLRRQPSRGVP